MNEKTILGIDVGTSSVKCAVVRINNSDLLNDQNSVQVVSLSKRSYNRATIQRAVEPGYSQQSVCEIVQCLNAALQELPQLETVTRIAFSCQMHGIVLWNKTDIFKQNSINFEAISDLYDWTDLRCVPEFLASLPLSNSARPASGYGGVTLCWLKQFQPELLEKYDCASTIGEFIAWLFSNDSLSGSKRSYISTHNAHSWGYFNPLESSWNVDLLENNAFPIHLLPKVVQPGTIVGETIHNNSIFTKIPSQIPIFVCIGDLQAILSCVQHQYPNCSNILNMGTSSQLCKIIRSHCEMSKEKLPSVVCFDPFYDQCYIAKAASLNGGNVLSSFVNFLQDITNQLTETNITSDEIWTKLDKLSTNAKTTNKEGLSIVPTLFGERHAPNEFLKIQIQHEFPSLQQMTIKMFSSLIDNLIEMMNTFSEENITSVVCTGSIAANSSIMRSVILERFQNVQFMPECDAEVGAVLFAKNQHFV